MDALGECNGAYVLLTPARNEANTLPSTVEAVLHQTVRPRAWVILSDASTDGTDELIQAWARQFDFIHFARRDHETARDSSIGKLAALRAAYLALPKVPYEAIGQLDADVTFGSRYFETLLQTLTENPHLGIVGGLIEEPLGSTYRPVHSSPDHVAGAVQFYRRSCWEQMLPLIDMRAIQEDTMAECLARWSGWETRHVPNLPVRHLRPAGTSGQSILRARFRAGMRQHAMGWRTTYVFARALYCIPEHPVFIGALVRLAGYLWSLLRGRRPFILPLDYLAHLHEEQDERLRHALRALKNRLLSRRARPHPAGEGR
jgi:glycosyltransferase involved in cell wall biosynthesis